MILLPVQGHKTLFLAILALSFSINAGADKLDDAFARAKKLCAQMTLEEKAGELRNTGSREGREVVQLYVRDEFASVLPRERELKEFTSVTLKPGESKTVEFTLAPDAFSLYDADLNKVVEPGDFRFMSAPTAPLKTPSPSSSQTGNHSRALFSFISASHIAFSKTDMPKPPIHVSSW